MVELKRKSRSLNNAAPAVLPRKTLSERQKAFEPDTPMFRDALREYSSTRPNISESHSEAPEH